MKLPRTADEIDIIDDLDDAGTWLAPLLADLSAKIDDHDLVLSEELDGFANLSDDRIVSSFTELRDSFETLLREITR